MATRTVSFEFKRQASPEAAAVWEKFELEWRPGMNVVSAMMEIAAESRDSRRQADNADRL